MNNTAPRSVGVGGAPTAGADREMNIAPNSASAQPRGSRQQGAPERGAA